MKRNKNIEANSEKWSSPEVKVQEIVKRMSSEAFNSRMI